MTRVAAFDCGTNSLRLLIADLDPESGAMTELAAARSTGWPAVSGAPVGSRSATACAVATTSWSSVVVVIRWPF